MSGPGGRCDSEVQEVKVFSNNNIVYGVKPLLLTGIAIVAHV